jgi:hypothetical protein
MSNLIGRIERLLRKNRRVKATHVGRAMGDPSLVRDMRNGRCLRPATAARLAAWLDTAERLAGDNECAR